MWREPMRRRVEDLLHEFVDRADELLRTQEHMQGLLSAVVSLAEDLDLKAVLERVVQSACGLVGARYGALGVMAEDESLSHFITVETDDDGSRLIRDLPAGHGVLGQIIREPKPLRLGDLGQHPMVSGLPPDHPPMKTFLGVPVRVREKIFGNLYLTEKANGEDFTAEDEDLATALAAAAGVAIENARLFEDTRRRQRWLEAGMDVSGQLMAQMHDGDAAGLELIAERALQVSDSALATVVGFDKDGKVFRCRSSVGVQALTSGESLPVVSHVLARVLETGESTMVRQAADVFGQEVGDKLGPLLIAPLGHNGTNGTLLVLARAAGSGPYPQSDVDSSSVFGSRVALALELAQAHREREEHMVFTDRDRIARDLHDLVIQRLFAAGLSIQSLRRFTNDPVALERIAGVTVELDETIRELRDTIYSLRAEGIAKESLTGRILRTVQDGSRLAEVTPRIQLNGPLDSMVPEPVGEHVLAVLSEALSNALRHAQPETIEISVAATDGRIDLLIADDGRGFAEPVRFSGLSNMRQRAVELGGSCEIESRPGDGTRVKWSAPLG